MISTGGEPWRCVKPLRNYLLYSRAPSALQCCPDCSRIAAVIVLACGNERLQSMKRRNLMGTILVVILVLLLLGALPTWPYSGGWGYYPSGGLGLVLLIVVILALTGRI